MRLAPPRFRHPSLQVSHLSDTSPDRHRPLRSRHALASLFLLEALLPVRLPAQEAATAPASQQAPAQPAANPADDEPWWHLSHLPVIPVPELVTAPHNGASVGIFPIALSNNDQGQTSQILAPDIIHSPYFGWGARFRVFRFPSDDVKWSVVGGGKQSVEREFDADYEVGLRRDRDWSWNVHAMYDRSGTGRFYGIGNDTRLVDQATFVDSQERLEATLARNFTPQLQLAYLFRADSVEIEQSAISSLPPITTRFPTVNGVGDASEFAHRFTLTYDTRDSPVVPHQGAKVSAMIGGTTRATGSSVNYLFTGVDAAVYRPAVASSTLVAHLALRYMPSASNAPFWALSQLGGESSVPGEALPLRAYGYGRFVDRNAVGGNLEWRNPLARLRLFETDMTLEVSPFVDAGKVFSGILENPVSHLHTGAGVGLRLIASPFVVGFLDIGIGNEKLAVFSGIDYPF